MERAQLVDEDFPKEHRILKRYEFLRIQKKGYRIYTSHFIFQFQTGRTPVDRLGLTVSKKVGNAVLRNQIKRWLRELFRRRESAGIEIGTPSFDLVITAKKDLEWKSIWTFKQEFYSALRKWQAQNRRSYRESPKRTQRRE